MMESAICYGVSTVCFSAATAISQGVAEGLLVGGGAFALAAFWYLCFGE